MRVVEISKKKFAPASEAERAKSKQMIEKLQKEGNKQTRGIFEFVDAQGGWLDFSYRFFPGEPIRTVHITHGEMIDIPIILAKHLNNVYKKVRMMPENADKGVSSVTKISRTRFIPVDILGEEFTKGECSKAAA